MTATDPAEVVRRYGLTADDLVIEVGGGDGTRLRAVRALGPRVLGVGPDARLTYRALREGVDTVAAVLGHGLADDLPRRYGPARLVVIADPRACTDPAAAGRCLTANGVVLIRWMAAESAGGRPDPRCPPGPRPYNIPHGPTRYRWGCPWPPSPLPPGWRSTPRT